jgi:Protein of unknown function (DUF2868)
MVSPILARAMKLSDLIDLEAQLARDRVADPAALEARDAGFAARSADRGAMLRRWLDVRRDAEPGQLFPGQTIAGALRGIRAALVVAGVVLGWSAATALLHYTGAEPVNVWDFLLALVGLQLLLFALLLASFFLPLAALGRPVVGLVRGIFAAVYPRIAARALPGGGAEWTALWHRLRSRRSLYRRVEPWILLGLTQAFGVAFNVGALLGCLRLIVFSDIAFSWSTTLVQLDSARFHAIVHALAAPFGWIWPDADPSRALVEATRYSRLERAYVLSGSGRAASPEMVGGWWPFLCCSVAFYGLLPRCLTLATAQIGAARVLARLPLDDVEVSRLLRRLMQPRVETRSPDAEAGAAPQVRAPAPRARVQGTRSFVVLWRDVPRTSDLEAAVARQTGTAVAAVQAAGGRDYEEGQLDWTRLADGADPVVVVAEGWEAPDKALHRLLRDLRNALGPRRHLVVLLARIESATVRRPSDAEVRIWEESLASLGDPYVGVEPLGAPT